MENVHLVYYSPALSTKKIMRIIARGMYMPVQEHDITQGESELLSFDSNDFVFFGVPVYAGRVPAPAMDILRKIKGEKTPAAIVCVYGNRDYDDALLELKDICLENDFVPIAAGAFIARHSIFGNVAAKRPDEHDKQILVEFGEKAYQQYCDFKDGKINEDVQLTIKGSYPYREPSKIPFVPKGNSKKCNKCGTCVKMCPTDAISVENPRKTDKEACISCARCITICPQDARSFGGLLYQVVRRKFESACKIRKEAEMYFAE